MIKCLFWPQYQNTQLNHHHRLLVVAINCPVQSNSRPQTVATRHLPLAACHSEVLHCHMKDKFADKNFGVPL